MGGPPARADKLYANCTVAVLRGRGVEIRGLQNMSSLVFSIINVDEVVLGPIQKMLEFNQYWDISRLWGANGCIICKFTDEILR